jgi:hypothetical protein
MSLALRTARIFWLKRTALWSAMRPAPAPAGDSHWCHGFCQRENKQNNIIIPHRTTSAKTRATAKLRQRHIPPNVRHKRQNHNNMRKISLISLLFVIINQFSFSQEPILKNGSYFVDFNDGSLEDYEFSLKDSIGIKYLKSGQVKGRIKWISYDLLVFYADGADESSFEGLEKIFYESFGHSCILINQDLIFKEKFYFKTVYTRQLNIIKNSGTIKRLGN